MKDIKELFARLKENEQITQKFHKVETKILSILNFKDLFEVLLTEISETFQIPYAWISLIEKSEISEFVQTLESSEMLRQRLNIIDGNVFMSLINGKTQPILINNNLRPYYKLLPQYSTYFIKSIAIAPLTLDGDVIGSLNQADSSEDRFCPGMDTSLLEQLTLKVSLCLSNVNAHEQLRFLAYHDSLTGLLNRRVMESVIKMEFSRAKRYNSTLSVVFIDMDKFKEVNDTFGHDKGDELLKYIAQKLNSLTRESDIMARFAGDEFVMILPETTKEKAVLHMNRITTHFAQNPFPVDDTYIDVSLSFGISSTEESYPDSNMLLKKADEELYHFKRLKKQSKERNNNVIDITKAVSNPN